MILNHSQDLKTQIEIAGTGRADYRLLCNLLNKPENSIYSRVFTAIKWFNAANNEANDKPTTIVNLAIAFEALLGLPFDEKTNRLIDSISLLLGRIPRLDIWAYQFYKVRSQIVHEGFSQQFRFIAVDSKKNNDGPIYQSLLSYGRQIFQLCLGTLLCGSELSENAGLKEIFFTNEERLQKVIKIYSDSNTPISDRLNLIDAIVSTIERYRFVYESNLKLETILNATKCAVIALKENCEGIPKDFKDCMESFIKSPKTRKHLNELEALKALSEKKGEYPSLTEKTIGRVAYAIIGFAWLKTFNDYFLILENLEKSPPKQ
jgi:hypothetical protein